MNENMKKSQDDIIEKFERFDDWFEMYQYLISLGRSLEPMDGGLRTDENRIGGCQSQVWIHADIDETCVHLKADSDSLLIKGLLSLLLRVVNDSSIQDIMDCELYFLEKTGLRSHLSPSRSNGLDSIIHRLRTMNKES
jgi:cysteine desulfuration protein SufE